MPAERLSLRKAREVLRLKWARKLSAWRVAGSLAMGRSTVAEYLPRAAAAGVPVKVVSERLGHSTVAFTMDVYQHVLPRQQREAVQGLADAVRGGATPADRGRLASAWQIGPQRCQDSANMQGKQVVPPPESESVPPA